MAYYGDNSGVIAVGAKGTAETKFTTATYRATVTCSAKTGPAAKDKALPIIEKIREAILKHSETGGIDTGRVKTTFGTDVERNRNTGEFVGYQAVYTAEFIGSNVKEAPAVHDALTSIEGVQAGTPVYSLDDGPERQAVAFAAAVGKAKAKFEAEAKACGLDPKNYVIRSWSIQEEQPRGKTLSFAVSAHDKAKPVGLEPGRAVLDITVNLAYVEAKATP
jgi:uncharacterized protein YggE